MTRAPLSEAIQDYLKGIYKLQQAGGKATVTALARDQGVSPASASAMLKKLAALDLLDHEPYRGARLTETGERFAIEVIRHHRLLELYLAETLGLDVDAVHDEADRLEHVISEELEERIDQALGYPTHDPHGDPIPDANLRWPTPKALARTRITAMGSQKEELVAEHVVREHHGGRSLDEILKDDYVTSRLPADQVNRILDRPDVVGAIGEDILAAHRTA
jgi:Mn-dependent DtxR family transcriptional regulator